MHSGFLQVTKEHTRKGAIWDFTITNKEGISQDVKVKESLGCSDLDMVQFEILRAGKKMKNKLMTLDLSKAYFGLKISVWRSSMVLRA